VSRSTRTRCSTWARAASGSPGALPAVSVTHARTHARTRAHARTHACTHARTRAHRHARARVHTHTHTRTHAHPHPRARTPTSARAHAHGARLSGRCPPPPPPAEDPGLLADAGRGVVPGRHTRTCTHASAHASAHARTPASDSLWCVSAARRCGPRRRGRQIHAQMRTYICARTHARTHACTRAHP
jgi:hypothetical protein